MNVVIADVSSALVQWFSTVPVGAKRTLDVSLATPSVGSTNAGKRTAPCMQLSLLSIREQVDRRTNDIDERRDDTGRVVSRRAATRFFDLDYACVIDGDPLQSHSALGGLIQLLIDHDVIPAAHVSDELAEVGTPIEVSVSSSGDEFPVVAAGALLLRVVAPIRPSEQLDIAEPVTDLHMDMGPPPSSSARPSIPVTAADSAVATAERRWNTVRRRERIAPMIEDGS